MNKKLIRLTESDLYKIIKESVRNILTENMPNSIDNDFYNFVKGFKSVWCGRGLTNINEYLEEMFYDGESDRSINDYPCKTIDRGEEYYLVDKDGDYVDFPYDSDTTDGKGIGLADTVNGYLEEIYGIDTTKKWD